METTTSKLSRTWMRLRGLVLIFAALAPPIALTACIQDRTVFAPFSVVTVQLVPNGNLPIAGVRCTLAGSGLTAGDNDFAFTDTTGFAQIRTQQTGFHYVVARHALADETYGGTAANLPPGGGAQQVFRRGRLSIPSVGVAVAPDFLFPFTGNIDPPSPQTTPRQLAMKPKTPGKAKFIYFVEDGSIIRRTFQPDNFPMPSGKVYVTGDFNNFNLNLEDVDPVNGAKEMKDDGNVDPSNPSGDDLAQDGAFTRVLDLPPGEHTYMFLQNGVGLYTRDPHEEFSKTVRVAVRTADNSVANPRELEIREFRASAITVVPDPNATPN